MFTIWVIFHVIVCTALVLVVLLQSAKGEGLAGSAFGGGGGGMGGAVFGGRGAASFLSRATTVLAVIFMFNCGALAFMSSSNRGVATGDDPGESVVTREAQKERDQALQFQQEQQQQAADSAAAANGLDIKILDDGVNKPADTGAAAPADTSGN
ncbi:MAG: preprotein translocase subunit SecG [bacterium]|nr:preprotein translocase subunit SecG [bacterium]